MDRVVADDASYDDAAVADSSAPDRRSSRDNDTLYRRPPAHPPTESTSGGSWFNAGTELPAEAESTPAEPKYGPATPAGSGRTSFGFTAGPISPSRRQAASPALPTRRKGPTETSAVQEIAPISPSWPPPALPTRRNGPTETSAVQEIAPISPSWPPPARITPDQDILERVQGGSADFPEWGTGEQRRFSDTGEQRRFGDTGQQRRFSDTGQQRRISDTGEQRRIKLSEGTGEHRRVARREAQPESLPPRQSRFVTIGMITLTAIVLLAGSLVGIVYFSGSNGTIDSVLKLGAGRSSGRAVTAPLDNRTTASFEMLAGVNTVRVTIGELGDDLYRISTPDDAGIEPSPQVVNDDVKLQVTKDGDGTGGEIEVVLSAKVRWALRFAGYTETQVVDVSGGQISGIEMVAGMRRAEVTLPKPSGTVPLKVNGAIEQLVVKSPVGSPVRVKVGGGAETVVAGTRTLRDVAAGATLTPKGWDTQNRYDIAAGARIASLTVENA